MRILIVEDDVVMVRVLRRILDGPGRDLHTSAFGEDAVELAKMYEYDIIVLDVQLPDTSGFEVLRRLRAAKVNTPVLVLSGLCELQNKIDGFELGATDYVVKPFQRDELVARLNAIVRRTKGHAHPNITIGELAVNLEAKSVEVNGKPVRLTGTEYAIVELLALRRGQPVTKEMLLDHLYGIGSDAEPKVIDSFMYKLRKKLAEATCGRDYIETAWGRGYTLREPTGELNDVSESCPTALEQRARPLH